MGVIASELNGKPVIGSGIIVSPGREPVFLYPIEADKNYKIKISAEFGANLDYIPMIYGSPGDEYFNVVIRRKWNNAISGSFTELLIAEGDESNLYINLVFNLIGDEDNFNIIYLYTIYQDKPEHAR